MKKYLLFVVAIFFLGNVAVCQSIARNIDGLKLVSKITLWTVGQNEQTLEFKYDDEGRLIYMNITYHDSSHGNRNDTFIKRGNELIRTYVSDKDPEGHEYRYFLNDDGKICRIFEDQYPWKCACCYEGNEDNPQVYLTNRLDRKVTYKDEDKLIEWTSISGTQKSVGSNVYLYDGEWNGVKCILNEGHYYITRLNYQLNREPQVFDTYSVIVPSEEKEDTNIGLDYLIMPFIGYYIPLGFVTEWVGVRTEYRVDRLISKTNGSLEYVYDRYCVSGGTVKKIFLIRCYNADIRPPEVKAYMDIEYVYK